VPWYKFKHPAIQSRDLQRRTAEKAGELLPSARNVQNGTLGELT
jgi:hypothetical protein